MQLKNTILGDDNVSIIVTDKSPVNRSLIVRIEALNYFKKVSYEIRHIIVIRKQQLRKKLKIFLT